MSAASPDPSTPSSTSGAGAGGVRPAGLGLGVFKDFNAESYAARLVDPDLPVKDKVSIAIDLRDSMDQMSQHADYPRYLATLVPAFLQVLQDGQPSFQAGSVDQRFRHTLLTLLHRFPPNPSLGPKVPQLFERLLHILKTDNEDNGYLCVKIIIDLVRSFKKESESSAKQFLECVKEMLEGMEAVVAECFPEDGGGLGGEGDKGKGAQSALNQLPQGKLQPAYRSFKVVIECPIAIVCIIQSYQNLSTYMLETFVPLAVKAISLQAGPQRKAHEEACAKGEINVAISPAIKNRTLFGELVFAQVKTVSFIAYVCRSWHQHLVPYAPQLAEACVRLLKDCPAELSSARKEIIVATRHIAGVPDIARPAFAGVYDDLLDERVLVGKGIMTRESLRILALGLLTDVFSTVRSDMNFPQIKRSLDVFLTHMHDATLPGHAHTLSVKVIVGLLEKLVQKSPDQDETARQLHRIVDALVAKLASVSQCKDDLVRMELLPAPRRAPQGEKDKEKGKGKERAALAPGEERRKSADGDVEMAEARKDKEDKEDKEEKKDKAEKEKVEEMDAIAIERAKPIGAAVFVTDPSLERVKEARGLFRFVLQALLSAISAFRHLPPSSAPTGETIAGLFEYAVQSFGVYDRRGDKEGAEALEIFFTILLRVDPLVFQEVFKRKMPFLIDEILAHPPLFNAITYFLSHEPQTQTFLAILLRFFVDHLEVLGGADQERITLFHKLFRHIMGAIQSPANEPIFRGHTGTLLLQSLKLAHKAENPINYYYLLRTLSSAIGGGRFESFYAEVQPLLQTYIDGLTTLLDESDRPARDLILQLLLIIPVRIQLVLPFLGNLIRPLCMALDDSPPDVVEQGLRLIEICVDTLNPVYVDPVFAPYIRDIQQGLYKLLKPVPYPHKLAHHAVRILGKLGGRNRKALTIPAKVETRPVAEAAVLPVNFSGRKQSISFVPIVDLAVKVLTKSERVDAKEKERALEVLKHTVAPFVLKGVQEIEQESTYEKALRALFAATQIEPLKEDATAFVRDLVRQVLIAELRMPPAPPDSRSGLIALTPLASVTLDVLTQSLTTGVNVNASEARAIVADAMKDLIRASKDEESGITAEALTHMLNQLASRFSSLCHDPLWRRKTAGLTGIDIMTSELDVGERWVLEHEIEFVKAAFFMLKDMPAEAPRNVDDVTGIIARLIERCNGPMEPAQDASASGTASADATPAPKTEGESRQETPTAMPNNNKLEQQQLAEGSPRYFFNHLVPILMNELVSAKPLVRQTTQKSLRLLADRTGMEVADILAPGRVALATSIFNKPLRALPVPMQTARIEAVTYCLLLRPPEADASAGKAPPVLEVNDDLTRFVHEVLGISDAEDVAIVGQRPPHKVTIALGELRVACVKLLTAATASSDIFQKHNQARMRIISVYFKSLYARSPELHSVAHDGIKQVLVQSGKVPKELLQTALKPILINLSDTRRINIPGLDGLARLLELLTNYFKVEIGTKLLEHFKGILEDKDLKTAPVAGELTDMHEVKIMVAVANVFRLLPAAANIYLQHFSDLIVETEARFRRSLGSPWTTPLAQYLSRFPGEANEFFFKRINSLPYFHTYRAALLSEHAGPLRDDVFANPERIVSSFFAPEAAAAGFVVPGLRLVRALLDDHPSLLANGETGGEEGNVIWEALFGLWSKYVRSDRGELDEPVFTAHATEIELLLDVLITHLKTHPDAGMLIYIAEIYALKISIDLVPLTRFFVAVAAKSRSLEFRREILHQFAVKLDDSSLSQAHLAAVVRHLVNPIVLVNRSRVRRGEEAQVVDQSYVSQLHTRAWRVSDSSQFTESLFIELLNHSANLAESTPEQLEIGNVKKELIKFGWLSHKHADMAVRHAGNILICRFITAFDSPSKITLQVLVGLLRGQQPESKAMVKEALDILTPVLPVRVPEKAPPPYSHFPQWAIWIRRVLVEEVQSVAQLSGIYTLLIRHADLFYPIRELFVPHMLNSITRMGIVPSAALETRQLSMDVLELILRWERQRLGLPPSGTAESADVAASAQSPSVPAKRSLDGEEPSPKRARADRGGAAVTPSRGYALPPSLRGHIVGYLVRFASVSPESISAPRTLPARAVELLKGFLAIDGASDVTAKLAFFHKTLGQLELKEEHLTAHCNSAEVLGVLALPEQDAWFISNLAGLHKIVEKGLTSDFPRLHRSLEPVLERMFAVLPPMADDDEDASMADIRAFVSFAESLINDGLGGTRNLHAAMLLLRAWSKSSPERIDGFVGLLMRTLQLLCREHLVPDKKPSEFGVQLTIMALDLARRRISHLGEARRVFLSCIVQLVERSVSAELCRFLLNMVRDWIRGKTEAFPTPREKAGLLIKMQTLETRSFDVKGLEPGSAPAVAAALGLAQSLTQDFLDLILDIYTDPAFARSELTVRLEQAFLLGCRNRNAATRARFIEIFDQSMSTSLPLRMQYVLGIQHWDSLADVYWLHQALDLVLGGVVGDEPLVPREPHEPDTPKSEFVETLRNYKVDGIIKPLRQLHYTDAAATHELWVTVFRAAWVALTRKEQADLTRHLINLLAKEYHIKQVDFRPNVVQSLLAGVLAASPPIALPPYLVKYLGKTFEAWHTAILLLEQLTEAGRETEGVIETAKDALAEIYAELNEDDMFYGLWRRRSAYPETNAALSYEQIGMWSEAQLLHEAAQAKGRSGAVPFNEHEYAVWEDHWILCAQKLQQWDLLTDLAKNEGNADLLFECAWRTSDWSADREVIEGAFKSLPEVATPRRRVFEAYMTLVRSHETREPPAEFQRLVNDAIQLSLKKWHSLPAVAGPANVPLLHLFQQFVELYDANQIFMSFPTTDATNIEQRSSELKNVLSQWRDRLPNLWDDVNIWSDLVAWRSHVFQAVNKVYIPLVNLLQTQAGGAQNNAGANSFGYRGYHEMAWTINRFAHVARKHQLQDVCIALLTKIYTLPNIEIQEAFLKLREQARCLYPNPDGLGAGLEVINNTNLHYFSPNQKAEFFTLKGMFTAKLGLHEDATQSFAHAVQTDLNLPKAWAEWGRYNDAQFKAHPENIALAGNAVSCYLQASGLYKNAKVRKLLSRVLWLLSLDDASQTISKAFETYKGEYPVWYWITLIPQLLSSLAHREARHARVILIQIAKKYPQSLFFHLRTAREEYAQLKLGSEKRAAAAAAAAARAAAADGSAASSAPPSQSPAPHAPPSSSGITAPSPSSAAGTPANSHIPLPSTSTASPAPPAASVPPGAPGGMPQPGHPGTPQNQLPNRPPQPNGQPHPQQQQGWQGSTFRNPWDWVDEVLSILKTAYPLLTLSLETMVDQIAARFKNTTEEDGYRFLNVLINDALSQYAARDRKHNLDLPPQTRQALNKFADQATINRVRVFQSEIASFADLQLPGYIRKLLEWRKRYEVCLDSRPRMQNLEHSRRHLVEFHHSKYDQIEIPGQYLKHEDDNSTFLRIARISPKLELTRSHGISYKRLSFIAHNGTVHPFAVQFPTQRFVRREERLQQLCRIFNSVLERRKESRKRNLFFTLPIAVPLAMTLRLVESDPSFVTLEDVIDRHCHELGVDPAEPLIMFIEKLRKVVKPGDDPATIVNLKMDVLDEVSTKLVPDDVLTKYMNRSAATASDLWLVRKQMTLQVASFIFLSYVMCLAHRTPHRVVMSRSTGAVYTPDILPTFSTQQCILENPEQVPFRLTPNMQNFLTPVGIEGPLAASIMAIGRCLTEPLFDLENQLSLFIREDVFAWYVKRPSPGDFEIRRNVQANVEAIVSRVTLLACRYEREQLAQQPNNTTPACQSILDLIGTASNPQRLALCDPLWMPWA